jgi:hypothetical protein
MTNKSTAPRQGGGAGFNDQLDQLLHGGWGGRPQMTKRQSAPRQGIEEGATTQTTISSTPGNRGGRERPNNNHSPRRGTEEGATISKTSWRRRRVQPPDQQDQPPRGIPSQVVTAQMTISRREGFHSKPVNPIELSQADLSCRPKSYQAVLSPTSPLFCHRRVVPSPSNLWTVGPSQAH